MKRMVTFLVLLAAFAVDSECIASTNVVGWGYNVQGQTTVPASLSNVVAVAGGLGHSLALRADGTVAAWGDNDTARPRYRRA